MYSLPVNSLLYLAENRDYELLYALTIYLSNLVNMFLFYQMILIKVSIKKPQPTRPRIFKPNYNQTFGVLFSANLVLLCPNYTLIIWGKFGVNVAVRVNKRRNYAVYKSKLK